MSRAAVVLGLALASSATALADKPVLQLATVTASSALGGKSGRHEAFRAFDADTRTSWCPARKDDAAGGSLTISFEQPVHVRSLTLYGSERIGEPERTLPLEVTSDGGTVQVSLEVENDQGQEIDVSAAATRSLRFHFGTVPGKDRKVTCLWDVELELAEGPLIYGVPPAARDALPGALQGINAALAECDVKQLPKWVRFPVVFRETAMMFVHHRSYSGEETVLARKPAELKCGALHDDGPLIDQGIGPGLVRVVAGAGTTTAYWEVVWRGGKWLLSGFDTVFFE